jgi:flagellar hook-basal body complex protein FliE
MKFDLDVTSSEGSTDEALGKGHGTSAECLPLLEAATLNIYRENPFRITGLPVDTTTKEIARHADKLKQMEELGYGEKANTAAFALDPPPSIDQIREAMQRLKEPERRLIDEFFWFWPATFGESANDPAIQALSAGDMEKAYEIWETEESKPATGFIANHNIAVMLHLAALDWTLYQINAEVEPANEERIRGYWKDSFRRWEKIPSDDRLWDAVKTRIRSVGDPRLTTGFGRRFADTLPAALDKINAEAGLKFAEQGRLEWARTHVQFMHETHQGLDNVAKTAEMVLAPLRKRVTQHIKTARETTQKDPKKGGEAAKLLVDECGRLHFLYELFHTKDAHQKTELFDEVAAASVDCVVDYQKSTDDNRLFVEVLRASMALATAVELRERIQRNLEIGEGNIRGEAIQPLYARLKTIRESKETGKIRLSEVKKQLMPELALLAESQGADSELTKDFSEALAGTLRGISIDAHNDEDDFDTAAEAIRLAVRLAKSSELKKRCEDDLVVAEKHFTEFQRSQVHLDIRGDKVSITRDVVIYNAQQIRVADVAGVRFGVFKQYTNGIPTSVSYLVGVSGGGVNIQIECKRIFRSEAQAKADYTAILEGLYQNVIPKLAAKIAKSIKAGSAQSIGGYTVTKDGVYFRTGIFKKVDHLVPWTDIRYGFHAGNLNVSSASKGYRASISVRNAWNAVIFEPIIKVLLA